MKTLALISLLSGSVFAIDLLDFRDYFKSCDGGYGYNTDIQKQFFITGQNDSKDVEYYNNCPMRGAVTIPGGTTLLAKLTAFSNGQCFYRSDTVSVTCKLK